MGRYLPLIILALLTIYCVVEVAQTPSEKVRNAPRWLWAVVVIGLPLIGPILWFTLGRPGKEPNTSPGRPSSPDDDPDFLRGL